MANELYISRLNPVQMYWNERPFPLEKNRYFLNEVQFANQIPRFYQKINYIQKWQTTDTIKMQLKANFDPVAWQVVDCTGKVLKSGNFTIATTNVVAQPYIYYEMSLQLADPDLILGQFYLIINAGFGENVMQWISEPQLLLNRSEERRVGKESRYRRRT